MLKLFKKKKKAPIWLMLFFNKQLMAGAWQLMIINGVFIGIRNALS